MDLSAHLEELQELLDYRFRNPALLHQALVHRSFVHENPDLEEVDNETLEFLGDAVLGLSVSHLIWQRFPDYKEGELSRLRSAIVNERELAKLALKLNLGDALILGKGEERTGGRHKTSLLADSLEALLAAVYLDGGLEAAIEVVRRILGPYLDPQHQDRSLEALDKDYKTRLQELTQARFKQTPTYFMELEEGPDHDKTFHVSVSLEEDVLAQGSGKSKKEAQQSAAKRALDKLFVEETLDREGE